MPGSRLLFPSHCPCQGPPGLHIRSRTHAWGFWAHLSFSFRCRHTGGIAEARAYSAHGHTEVQHRSTNYGLEPQSYECCESKYTMRIREILGNRLQLRYRLALHVIGSPPHKGCDGPVIAVTATLKNACHHPPTPQDGSHM